MRASTAAKAVLIPLGRSLQRNSAAPEFFAYPRAVVAADAEPAGTGDLYLKDRLYLGYQEKANLLEVISYNEDAGRFEFQVVTDYRAGGTPRIAYANRTLCVACHQNAAPIFSRAVWDETNANPRVAALLASQRKDFHGIPVDRGVDVPNAIDDADAARQPVRGPPAALERRMRRQRRACREVSRRAVRGAAPVPAVRAAAIRPRRRVVPQRRRGTVVGGRAPAMAGRARDRQPRSPESQPVAGRSADVTRDRPSRLGATSRMSPRRSIRCCRARRWKSGASPSRTTSRGLSSVWPISSPNRTWSVSTTRCSSERRLVGAARRTYRGTCEVQPAPAAGGSQRIEFRCASRQRRPIAACPWTVDCSWSEVGVRRRDRPSRDRRAAAAARPRSGDDAPRRCARGSACGGARRRCAAACTRAARTATRSSASNCAGAIATGPQALSCSTTLRRREVRSTRWCATVSRASSTASTRWRSAARA